MSDMPELATLLYKAASRCEQAGDDQSADLMRHAAVEIERLLTREAAPQEGRETGWLVENHDDGTIRYLRLSECGIRWVTDSLDATRFCRRADAEHAAEGGELLDLRIAEHMWIEQAATQGNK